MRRAAALAVALVAPAALACPVCGETQGPARWAYFVMTIILSLLPLALIGGVVATLVVRTRRAEAAALRTRGQAQPPAPGRAG